MKQTLKQLFEFFAQTDENGISNFTKLTKHQKILRRVESTDKNLSVEAAENTNAFSAVKSGIVIKNGKLIGFGIHIFNEDVYPLKSFEITLRNCELTGLLTVSDCEDMVFLDVYHNKITGIQSKNLPAMRIFGVQDNLLTTLDVSEMPLCQGIDAGKNRLTDLDVSNNPELAELYINDNAITAIDLSRNKKLKYFYCHNNRITVLDTRSNPLLRHLNATLNPMKQILSLAPQKEQPLPLSLYAGFGGCVGLKFNPVYNAQWKETGEWQQTYYAYPDKGFYFKGWYENGVYISNNEILTDTYGASRILTAEFLSL